MRTAAEHRADMAADPGDRRHGTRRGVEIGCRCERCAAERARLNAERRERDRERRLSRARKPAASKPKPKPRRAPKDVCTVDALMLPMMGRPSADRSDGRGGHLCCVCGAPATDRHHVVRRGAGKLAAGGREVAKPTVRLCGHGNASGCHGMAHAGLLHFRWVETRSERRHNDQLLSFVGGHWEYLETEEPCKYQDALAMEGWRPLCGR